MYSSLTTQRKHTEKLLTLNQYYYIKFCIMVFALNVLCTESDVFYLKLEL